MPATESLNQSGIVGSMLHDGWITQDQYDKALVIYRKKRSSILRILTEIGALPEERRLDILSKYYNWKIVDLSDANVNLDLANEVGRERCGRYRVFPVEEKDGNVIVAMEDPTDLKAIEDLEIIFGRPVTAVVSASKTLDQMIAKVELHSNVEVRRLNERRIRGFVAIAFLGLLTLVPIGVSYYMLFSDPEFSQWFSDLQLTSYTTSLVLMMAWIGWASIAYFITDLIFGSRR